MKLSKRGEYALRALIDLGVAHEAGRGMVQVKEIVQKENIPAAFLEQIFVQLREAGYIAARRGKLGGYYLLKPPADIVMGEIVRLIDGSLAPIGCVSNSNYEKCTCPDETHCGLRMLMLDVHRSVSEIMDRYTLADIVEITLRKLKRDGLPIPFGLSA